MKKSKIEIEVTLDDEQVPTEIRWKADDSQAAGFKAVKSIFLSLYDEESEETMKLDLWTKEFRVDEMDKFIFQTLRTMADSYYKATNNGDLANHMVQFTKFFGTETGLLRPENSEDDQKQP
ncbi:gliding motility protein GldC [Membranicola marinus]|uniref:Gliding motility protein GldC n=1 Tax=Membranihabitans marinus TaxID=1227546 RepID=A0A953HSG7_9BACT|nr:gliding motility protein GldC [Membranihabitans marinus]MBY5960113.1 gliding motility protein GldC [Membranihabitans marinus]